MNKETRPYIVIVLVGHKPKYYFGWNIEGATYEQMKHICCGQELAISREYKTTSAVLFQYKPEAGMYVAVHECNWTDKDSKYVADFYTPESMEELRFAIEGKKLEETEIQNS